MSLGPIIPEPSDYPEFCDRVEYHGPFPPANRPSWSPTINWNFEKMFAPPVDDTMESILSKFPEQMADALAKYPYLPGYKLMYDTVIDTDSGYHADEVILRMKNFRYEKIVSFEDD